jgi:hypothetical protein
VAKTANKVKAKTAGKRRTATGWTLLLLGLLVAGVWVASRGRDLGRGFDSGAVWAKEGTFAVAWFSFSRPVSGWFLPRHFSAEWEWKWFTRDEQMRAMVGHEATDFTDTNFFVAAYTDVVYVRAGRIRVIEVVLWPIPLLLWTPAALLLRSGYLARRRANTGSCAKCGYSLARLGAGVPCPECGKGAVTK